MGRATLGAFRLTLLGVVAAESGLAPARALLDRRQARFARASMPDPGVGTSRKKSLPEREPPSPHGSGQPPPSAQERPSRPRSGASATASRTRSSSRGGLVPSRQQTSGGAGTPSEPTARDLTTEGWEQRASGGPPRSGPATATISAQKRRRSTQRSLPSTEPCEQPPLYGLCGLQGRHRESEDRLHQPPPSRE